MISQTPIGYHYANQPTKSVDQVREVVFDNFGPDPAGLPGNDDQGAMATLLIFHLLGFYPGQDLHTGWAVEQFTDTLYSAYHNSVLDPESILTHLHSSQRIPQHHHHSYS